MLILFFFLSGQLQAHISAWLFLLHCCFIHLLWRIECDDMMMMIVIDLQKNPSP